MRDRNLVDKAFDLEKTLDSAEAQITECTANIEELGQSVDAARLFVAVHANLAIAPVDQIKEATHGTVSAKMELLAYLLYPLFGASDVQDITPWDTNHCLEALEELFRLRALVSRLSGVTEDDLEPVREVLDGVRAQAEIVRGSAYPEQTSYEITSVQGRFENWFSARLGIGPNRAQAILWAILEAQETSLDAFMPDVLQRAKELEQSWREVNSKSPDKRTDREKVLTRILADNDAAGMFGYVEALNSAAPVYLPVAFSGLQSLEPPLTLEEWNRLIDLVGMTPTLRQTMSDPLEVKARPLYVMPDRRVILVDIANALDVLWEVFDKCAKEDERFLQRYQKAKAKWLEERVTNLLARVFEAENVFQGLTYPDPDKPQHSKATAQLDIAVYWDPFLILVEAKARQFRMEGQLGDAGRLFTDLKANVEDAFEQARRAAIYVSSASEPEFTEVSTGRKLSVDKANLHRVYLITVSQHHLAGLATRLATLQDLGLFKDGEYPLSISVADLETVLEFCGNPAVFLHYVERRLETQYRYPNTLADELDFFGAYLDTRLQPSRIWEREGEDFDAIWLGGWSDRFDRWFMFKRGDLEESPEIKLDVPDEIHRVLGELRRRDDDAGKWISFALLDLSDEVLGAIARTFQDLQTAKLTPGMFRRMVYQDGDTVLSIVASLGLPPELLSKRTEIWAVLEKYRRKALRSIGLGVMVLNPHRPFEYAVWVEGPWEYDEELEKALQAAPPFVPAPGQKLPGRNEPCICGSGKKFKYCCLRKIRATEREMSS